MNPAMCCLSSSWTSPSPLALLHHPPPTSAPEPGPGSLPQEAPPTARNRLHIQGPETAEGPVKGKTLAMTESLPQFSFGCVLFILFLT